MTKTNFSRIAFAVLIMIVLLPIQSWAQADVNSYKVGERVEYNDDPYNPVWYEGTVVRLSPEYKQVIVHWDPRADSPTYTKNGVSIFQKAYSISDVRHIKARADDKAKDKKDDADATINPADNAEKDKTEEAKTADIQGGTGLMTKEEILGYMKTNGFVNGVAKYDQQVCRDLIEQIKRRGVKEVLNIGIDDVSPISKTVAMGRMILMWRKLLNII